MVIPKVIWVWVILISVVKTIIFLLERKDNPRGAGLALGLLLGIWWTILTLYFS